MRCMRCIESCVYMASKVEEVKKVLEEAKGVSDLRLAVSAATMALKFGDEETTREAARFLLETSKLIVETTKKVSGVGRA